MGGYLKPIGGEQWFDIELFNNELDNFKNTRAVFIMIKDNTLLELSILIEDRDKIRKKLRKFNIYCPVH